MASYTCPEGHTSQSGDYCDVCGSPIPGGVSTGPSGSGGATPTVTPAASSSLPPPLPSASASSSVPASSSAPASSSVPAPSSALDLDAGPVVAGPAPGGPASTASKPCPNCQAANLPGALFCEDCGYDFTTGQLPRPLDPPAGMNTPTGLNTPAVGLTAAPAPSRTPGPSSTPVPAAGSDAPSIQPPPTSPAPPDLPPSALPVQTVDWVIEVWVDPDWYAAQDVTDPCPSAGMPVVVPLHARSVLVGRTSTSRNIHPEVDLAGDTGVSRRHAQLSTDGQRWWVEDLQSANGTYVGAAGEALPGDPIAPGQRVELPEDGRVYVGAWTRLVVRKASPSERTST